MAIETVTFQTTTLASPPSGTAVAVDTIGGAEYQVIKIALGADGAYDTLVDSGQQTMANSIPVAIASNQSTLPISIEADNVGIGGGTEYAVDAALGATPTGKLVVVKRDDALSTLTPVEGDAVELRADANGALWTHDNALDAALSGSELQVDVVAALPAGDNAIGRVKITDGTEVVNVNTNNRLEISIEEDNVGIGGGTQYAVDAALGATPTGTLAIAIRDDALSALTPVEGDAIGLRVDANGALWVIPSGTVTVANGGTFAVQEDGAALTALQLIDDIVATDDTSAHATGTTKGAVIMAAATPTDGSVDANDLGALAMSLDRRLLVDAQIAGQDADVTIADGGNAITVDAANDGSLNVTIGDGTNTATIRDLAANDALNVAIVDGSGNQITSFGGSGGTAETDDAVFTAGSGSGTPIMGFATSDTVDTGDVGVLAMDTSRNLKVSIEVDNVGIGGGTQYAVDAALGATPTGTLALAIRDDALSALTPVEGDAIGLRVDANGALWTIPSGTVTVTDDGSFTLAANSGVDIGDVTLNNGFASVVGGGVEATALRVTIASDSTGVLSVDDNGGSLTIDNADLTTIAGAVSGSEMQVDVVTIPGAAAEAAALPSVFVVVAGDDGTDTHPLQTATDGDLKVTLDGETITVDLGANNDVVAAGDVAHDSADSGNPVKVGGVAYNFDGSAPGTAVAEGDRAEFATDVYGRQFVETAHPNSWDVSADYASAQTNTTIKAAPGAGLRLYITDYMISNGATAGNITILDGSAGTVKIELYPAANGGASANLRTPIALTANTALVITSTTVTTHAVNFSGYIAP